MQHAIDIRRPAPEISIERITIEQLAKFDQAHRAAMHVRNLEQMLREQDEGHARRRAKLVHEINVNRSIAETGLRETAEAIAAAFAAKGGV